MTSVSNTTQVAQIKSILRQASKATGTDFDYMLKTAQRESSLRPHVKAKTSSATGLFQFIDQTWLATLKKSGHQFGYGTFADAIERLPNGRHKVSDPAMRGEVFALRKDPLAASLMAGAYTRDAAERLSDALGRQPLKGELYVAHFLGPGGAIKLIKAAHATPDKPAADIFPMAARANKPAFYNRNGTERSALDVYKKLISIYGPGKAEFADIQTADATALPAARKPQAPQVQPAAARVQLASHFQNVRPDALGTIGGRPFDSLFITPAANVLSEPDSAPAPPSGPLVIIPVQVQADATRQQSDTNPGSIPLRPESGPLNIIPRGPVGLAQKHAPLHNLFRTDTQDA